MVLARRWILACAVCWCLFINHYSRDVTGALEREIEHDLRVNSIQFQALNSIYFAPNLIMPLLMGAVSQWLGASRMLLIVCTFALLGHVLVGYAGQSLSYTPLLWGRGILGITYESIDITPLPILAPLFGDCWGLLVGLFNAWLRMGSVTNFLLTPVMYDAGGLAAALWTSCVFGMIGFAMAVFAYILSKRLHSGVVGSSGNEEPENRVFSSVRNRHRELGIFCLYTTTGGLIYAAIVPFWFYGGGFIRSKWDYSLHTADLLMLLTEGGMVIFSPPLGMLVDAHLKHVQRRLIVLSLCSLVIPTAFVMLAFVPAATMLPVVPMALLSVGYAATNTLFWSFSGDSQFIPKDFQALGAGIIGSVLNLGATALPVAMSHASNSRASLMMLALASILSTVCTCCLCLCMRNTGKARSEPVVEYPAQDLRTQIFDDS